MKKLFEFLKGKKVRKKFDQFSFLVLIYVKIPLYFSSLRGFHQPWPYGEQDQQLCWSIPTRYRTKKRLSRILVKVEYLHLYRRLRKEDC